MEVIASPSVLKNGICSLEFKERMAWKEVTLVIGRAGGSSIGEQGWVTEAELDYCAGVIQDCAAWRPLLCL